MHSEAADGAAAGARERGARPPDRAGARAAAPATPATSPPRSRSRSTASARAAARRTTPSEFVLEASLAAARRGRAGGDPRGARDSRSTERASASSSRGRSSTSSSPAPRSTRDRGDAALLEVDPAAGEVVDDLRERRLVADDEHARVAVVGVQQLERVVAVEAVGERRLVHRLDVQRRGRRARRSRARGPSGSCSRRRTRRRAGRAPRRRRSAWRSPARGQLALVRRAWSRAARPRRAGAARAAAPSRASAYAAANATPAPRSASSLRPLRVVGARGGRSLSAGESSTCQRGVTGVRAARPSRREALDRQHPPLAEARCRRTTTISSSPPPSNGQVSTTRPTRRRRAQSRTCGPSRVHRRRISPLIARGRASAHRVATP